ncbi:MAG: MarR family winged helix-turn-helix transcriptional regulator [Atopobiaceae bacterium]|nr:MarR family winged helix-turn-helix transcriptional regulator [Atopobiaceae bacterium]
MRYSGTSSIESVASKVLHADELSAKAEALRADQAENAPSEDSEAKAAKACLETFESLYRISIPLLRCLSQGNATVLLYLDTHKHDTSAVRIAEEVGLTRPRITQIIDDLEEQGLAKRVKDPHDARKIRVTITRKGKKLVAGTRQSFQKIIEDYGAVIGQDQLEELTGILNETYALLQELGQVDA